MVCAGCDEVVRHNPSKLLSLTATTTAVLHHFFGDDPGEPVPEENFWTLRCKGRLTEADIPTIWLDVTPSGLTIAHLHHPPFFRGQMPFLSTNQQCQRTEGKALKALPLTSQTILTLTLKLN